MSESEPTRHPYFGKPPAREPRPALDEPALKGKRMVLSTPEGFVYDVRAIGQIQRDANGKPIVDVATEEDYFRWMFTGQRPRSQAYPAHLVWVE